MSPRFEVVTFDCYGTLIDWEGGISDAFLRQAEIDWFPLERELLLAAYHSIEPLVERPPYRSYREVLAQAAVRVAARFGWKLPAKRAQFLAASLPFWKPFPDTNPALTELVAMGYRLGILSNVDDDLLTETRGRLTAPFDVVVTAQHVRSYKPALPHFREAQDRIGDATWLHAAQSWFHDVVPATGLGISVAWVNRKAEPRPDGAEPIVEVRDLAALADWLR